MHAEERRETILKLLRQSAQPVSASTLAGQLSVSRQIIVGDIALLRAGGADIFATPRGYCLQNAAAAGLTRRVAVRHDEAGMEAELNTMVDNGCTVVDVIVEHPLYGQLTGPLRDRFGVLLKLELYSPASLRSHRRHPPSHAALPQRGRLPAGTGRPAAGRLPAGGIKLSVDKHTDSVYSVLDRCQDTRLTHYF